MAKKNSKTAQPVENIASVRASELAEAAAPAQTETINEADGKPIFHADEEAGDGDE